jgi:hypothetical protein
MDKPQIKRYGLVLVLVFMVNVGMVWAQSNVPPAADGSWHDALVAFIQNTVAECRPLLSHGIEMRRGVTTEPAATNDALREQEDIPEPVSRKTLPREP